jgi:metal-dependent HD superfamily phosphatase/phosphodiesterase
MIASESGAKVDLEARIRRLEDTDEIRQLVSRYSLALDSRDVDQLASLFVSDVQTHDGGIGRKALAAWFDPVLRPYRTTFHLVGNHVIEFSDDDHAVGWVYCRPEHEVGDLWVVMPVIYDDRYEREDGRWYFKSRRPHAFYAADVNENPLDVEARFNFPDNPFVHRATLPERWDTWRKFWGEDEDGAKAGA